MKVTTHHLIRQVSLKCEIRGKRRKRLGEWLAEISADTASQRLGREGIWHVVRPRRGSEGKILSGVGKRGNWRISNATCVATGNDCDVDPACDTYPEGHRGKASRRPRRRRSRGNQISDPSPGSEHEEGGRVTLPVGAWATALTPVPACFLLERLAFSFSLSPGNKERRRRRRRSQAQQAGGPGSVPETGFMASGLGLRTG